jgi:hypothetical protein
LTSDSLTNSLVTAASSEMLRVRRQARGGAVHQQPRRLEMNLHVGDLVRDCLELADRLAELRARSSVGDRGVQQALDGADVRRNEQRAFPVHRRAEHAGAAADAAEHRLVGELASSNTSSPTGEVRRPILANFWPAEKPATHVRSGTPLTPP